MNGSRTGIDERSPASPGYVAPPDLLIGAMAPFFVHSDDVLVVLDGAGFVRAVSPSVLRVLGYPADRLVGRSVLAFVHPDDRAEAAARAGVLLGGGAPGVLELRMARRGEPWVPMRWSLVPGGDGQIYGIGRDHADESRRDDALLREEVAEMRLRTARELHDGILQTLTAASLQIAVARRLVRRDPSRAEDVLAALGGSVSAEQRELRLYVDELNETSPSSDSDTPAVSARIRTIMDQVRTMWGLDISLALDLPDDVGGEVGRQVVRIIQEATVNAVRHGGAQAVAVAVGTDDRLVRIVVEDRGRGFSFRGSYTHEELREQRLGPLSLKNRVEDAGGRIHITSTEAGSTISVEIPRSASGRTA